MRNPLAIAACLALLAGALGQGVVRMGEALAQPGPTVTPSRTATHPPTQSGPTETPTSQSGPTETPTSQLETPIVDPEPGPGKVFLPFVVRGEDAALPPPVVAGDRGWVASLTQRGREACAPATHVLLEKPEGAIDNRAIAVLENRMEALELHFYIGEFVEASGIESMSAEACRQTTSRHIGVVLIRRVPRPPGG